MKPTTTIKGYIYRVFDSGASDKVINIIDTNGSKKSFIAKGVKKQFSRKSHSIDLGNFVKAKIVEGYNVPIVSDVELLSDLRQWKKDFVCLTALQLICEIINNFCFEENHDPRLFKTVSNILGLEDLSDITLIMLIFIVQILDITGNLPDLSTCVITGEKLLEDQIFILEDHVGYVSNQKGMMLTKIDSRFVKAQKFVLKTGLFSSLKLSLDSEEKLKLLNIHISWLETLLEKKLKSVRIFIKALEEESERG